MDSAVIAQVAQTIIEVGLVIGFVLYRIRKLENRFDHMDQYVDKKLNNGIRSELNELSNEFHYYKGQVDTKLQARAEGS